MAGRLPAGVISVRSRIRAAVDRDEAAAVAKVAARTAASVTQPMTRIEAAAQGLALYSSGSQCKKGHFAPRDANGRCVLCMRRPGRSRLGLVDTRT